MKRSAFAILALFTTPALGCNPALFDRVDVPTRHDADVYVDVAEIQSTEGGEWKVWLGPDGGAEEVLRIDYGEMGRWETRLFVQSQDAYAITQTRYGYAAPIYAEGAMTIRIETDIYMFCEGALLLPPEDFGLSEDYAKQAREALAVFGAKEIKDHVPLGL